MRESIACVVPARLDSSRFPAKLLHPLAGMPIILHTLRRAQAAECFSELICLTDSEEIKTVVEKGGFRAALTGAAANGTDRIGRNLASIGSENIVNLQGDEPVFPIDALRLLARALEREPDFVHVLVHDLPPAVEDLANPNRVKTGLDAEGRVRDFYRTAPRHPISESRLQMGAYGYGKNFLKKYAALSPSELEISESHELLRDLGLAPIRAHACREPSQAIDVPQDLDGARRLLARGMPETR